MGTDAGDGPAGRDEVISLLTLDAHDPASVLFCVSSAREGARRVRDVFSAEMWEAINTFHLGLLRRDMSAALRSGPYSLYAFVRERCALFWGVTDRTMLRDEARAFLEAGAAIEAADMVLRMLRVALPEDASASRSRRTRATARRWRCCRRWAASRRSGARSRRLRRRASSAASCSTSAPTRTRWRTPCRRCTTRSRRRTRATAARRPCCASRLMADLDFRSRSIEGAGPLAQTLGPVQRELELVDGDIALRYFGGASAPIARLATA